MTRILPAIALAFAFAAMATAADDLESLEQKAFLAAVDRVAPSVVRIETIGGLERVGDVQFGAGPTTGLVVSEDGYIVSSAFNFVNEPTSILIQLPDRTRKPAELVATDHNRMLVLLKIEPDTPLPIPEPAPPEAMRVGQWAIAVGRTFPGNEPNVAVGIISALGRVWGKAIQTDTAVGPNNYGGPLVDIRGRVLGVLMPMSPDETEEVAGYPWYDSGIGFAVPLQDVLDVFPRLKTGNDLVPGLLGVGLGKDKLLAGEPVIATVRPNSPAFKAGIRAGDRVAEIDGRPIQRLVQLKAEIARRYAGDTVRFAVVRDEKRIEWEVPLVAELDPYQHPLLGVLPMRGAGGNEEKPDGVVVRFVYPNSPAATAELRPGDRLVSIDGHPVSDAEELRRQISGRSVGDTVELEIRSQGKTRKAEVKLAAQSEDMPPTTLPPAHEASGRAKNDTPADKGPEKTAMFKMKAPELENEASAYVPRLPGDSTAYGLVVWLHAPGGLDEKTLFARWKTHCDRDGLILLAPEAADPDEWSLADLAFVRKLIEELKTTYPIDPRRSVVAGQQGGGTLGYLIAFQDPQTTAAVIAIDAPMLGRPPENEPSHRLAFYVGKAEHSDHAKRVESSIARLREQKYPVTVKSLGDDPREFTEEELSDLLRWIDALDRI